MMRKPYLVFVLLLCCYKQQANAQTQIVDEIIAIVGDHIILRSSVEMEYQQLKSKFDFPADTARCLLLDKQIVEKMMLVRAELDSIPMSDDRVEAELDKRIKSYESQFGGRDVMEQYLGMTVAQIKVENREKIKNQLLIQDVQQTILSEVKVSPTEVRNYFNSIPKDSLPYYSAEAEVGVITRLPKVTPEEKSYAYNTILDLRNRVLQGENFNTLARLYSQDPGSGFKGGELGMFGRNQMVPEFEAAAFRLKPDSISKIIETQYGYHILKLIERKGDMVNVRHILIKPQTVTADLDAAKHFLDSLRFQLQADSIAFEDAARLYNDDETLVMTNGLLSDYSTGSTRIPVDMMEKELFFTIENMKEGELSEPKLFKTQEETLGYRMVYLKRFYPPHTCNMKDDYQKIQELALGRKKQKAMEDWVAKNRQQIYVWVNPKYTNCPLLQKWVEKP